MKSSTRKLLILIDWFAPGYKAGGPIKSCLNLAYSLRKKFEIFVYTSDRDLGDSCSYSEIITDKWHLFDDNINIFYASPPNLKFNELRKIILEINPHTVYLNSMFSKPFTIYPLLFFRNRKEQIKLILAPRGMLKKSALDKKRVKKIFFIHLFKLLGIFKNVSFHATNKEEAGEISKHLGNSREIKIIPNFPTAPKKKPPQIKQKNQTNLLFVARIHPIKNLDYLLSVLLEVGSEYKVNLQIIGPLEDKDYWLQCKKLKNQLPPHIQFEYMGPLPQKEINQKIGDCHFFVSPTKGENFGHAIFESLAKGRPVIISDQTPWKNLMKNKAGWDIPLLQRNNFIQVIEQAAIMNQEEYNVWSASSYLFAKDYIKEANLTKQYLNLFS